MVKRKHMKKILVVLVGTVMVFLLAGGTAYAPPPSMSPKLGVPHVVSGSTDVPAGSGSFQTLDVHCPAGEYALGGGPLSIPSDADPSVHWNLELSMPLIDANSVPIGWVIDVRRYGGASTSDSGMTLRVVCAASN